MINCARVTVHLQIKRCQLCPETAANYVVQAVTLGSTASSSSPSLFQTLDPEFAAGRPNDHLWPSEAVNEDGRNLRFAATSLLRLATSTMPW